VHEFAPLVILCWAATYIWRGLGVALARRLDTRGEAFRWASCVAFAMIAGLITQILLLPSGALSGASLTERLGASAVALGAYFLLTRRNLFVGVVAGSLAIVALRLAGA